MANISVSNIFVNGQTSDATGVNQNFTDLINGTSDGTKDFNISALTAGGTATLNGAVNLGNATSDDISVNGYVATDIISKTDGTYDLGSAAIMWALTYSDVYYAELGSAASPSYRFNNAGTVDANTGMFSPAADTIAWSCGGTEMARLDSNGHLSLTGNHKKNIHTVSSANYTITDTDGYDVILVSTGSSDRTITLPTAADNTGRIIRFKKTDSGTGNVILDGEGSETIDGKTTRRIYTQYGEGELTCDGTTWHITDPITEDSGELSLPAAIDGNGTTDPTSVTGDMYRWVRNGNQVHLTWIQTGTGSSTDHTSAFWTMPTTMPKPRVPLSLGSGHFGATGSGCFRTALTGYTDGSTSIYWTGSAMLVYILMGSGQSLNTAHGCLTYVTDDEAW